MFSRKRSHARFLQVAPFLILLAISCIDDDGGNDAGGGTSPPPPPPPPFPGGLLIERVSVSSDGTQGNNSSSDVSISSDGRYIAFRSHATNLVSPDTNAAPDIFVHDRETGITERVNVATDGAEANDQSGGCFISGDGRFVVFDSIASNLVPSDLNNKGDVFVIEYASGTIERVNTALDGTESNGASGSSISTNGRYVTFQSSASDLVNGDVNGMADIFLHDRQTSETKLISVASDGTQGDGDSSWPHISPTGEYVAFSSVAQNLVPGDTNLFADAFLHNMTLGTTERVSIASGGGAQGDDKSNAVAVSADGNIVVFSSDATNLISVGPAFTNIFVRDRSTSSTVQISLALGGGSPDYQSGGGSISADGRYVVFQSQATNLVAAFGNGIWFDIFVHDLVTGETAQVNIAADGTLDNGQGRGAKISADGRYIVFYSDGTNLVPEFDLNSARDVFVAPNPLMP